MKNISGNTLCLLAKNRQRNPLLGLLGGVAFSVGAVVSPPALADGKTTGDNSTVTISVPNINQKNTTRDILEIELGFLEYVKGLYFDLSQEGKDITQKQLDELLEEFNSVRAKLNPKGGQIINDNIFSMYIKMLENGYTVTDSQHWRNVSEQLIGMNPEKTTLRFSTGRTIKDVDFDVPMVLTLPKSEEKTNSQGEEEIILVVNEGVKSDKNNTTPVQIDLNKFFLSITETLSQPQRHTLAVSRSDSARRVEAEKQNRFLKSQLATKISELALLTQNFEDYRRDTGEEITDLKTDYTKQITSLKTTQANKVTSLNTDHQGRISTLKNNHSIQIEKRDTKISNLTEERDDWKTKYNDSQNARPGEIQEAVGDAIGKNNTTRNQEITRLTNGHATVVQTFENRILSLRSEIDNLNEQIELVSPEIITSQQQELEKLRGQNSKMNAQIEQLTNKNIQISGSNTDLTQKIADLKGKIANTKVSTQADVIKDMLD